MPDMHNHNVGEAARRILSAGRRFPGQPCKLCGVVGPCAETCPRRRELAAQANVRNLECVPCALPVETAERHPVCSRCGSPPSDATENSTAMDAPDMQPPALPRMVP